MRLRQVLQQSLASLVARARGRIRELWGELHTADDEQAAFAAFHVADGAGVRASLHGAGAHGARFVAAATLFVIAEHLTDEVLQQHEAEIVRLQERWDRLRPVLRVRCARGAAPRARAFPLMRREALLQYIQRREQLLLEREEYDELVTDSSRLLSRRSGKAYAVACRAYLRGSRSR